MSKNFNEVLVPSLGVNENSGTIIEWVINRGSYVNVGDRIGVVETTKVAIEIEAFKSGYIDLLSMIDEEVHVGQCIGLIFDTKDDLKVGREEYLINQEKKNNSVSYTATRKAESLAKELSIDLSLVAKKTEGIIRERDVSLFYSDTRSIEEPVLGRSPITKGNNGRVLVVGGGMGATQVLSVLLHENGTEVIGIIDDTADKQGTSVMGVPVLGYVSDLKSIVGQYGIESVICSVSTSVKFRKNIFKEVSKLNLRLANAIHASTLFDDDVLIGAGNYIGANCYFGNSTSIGDYCFISSGCIFEHHNTVGNGISTGPQVVTSGCVTIGDEVKFGTGIYVEPKVKIGAKAVISSGSCITDHVSEKDVLRKDYHQYIK